MNASLQSVSLDAPVWVGEWTEEYTGQWVRWIVSPNLATKNPTLTPFGVWLSASGAWRHTCPTGASGKCPDEGYATCDDAKLACEQVIISTWRTT